ncbi:MAG: ubiquitin-like small modifier protein 1 [Candidatus Limnocylindrales bacterium]
MSRVLIPQVLRPETGGARAVDVDGTTVGEVVVALLERHPALGGRLLAPEGGLHRFVNVYLNGADVRYLDGLDTRVEDRDEVRLLPAIAGG